MEETNCLQHCLLFSLMTLQAIALLILKVVRFSAVGCLLNLRSAFFRSASNHGLTTCFGDAEDLGMVSSAIEIKVSVKLAMASGLLWMSAVSLSSQSCSSASSWSLMFYYNGEMVTPTKVIQYSPREVQQQIGLGYCEIYCRV